MSKSTPTDSDCRHLSTASALSNKAGITRSTQFDQQAQACQGHTPCGNKGKCCIEVHGDGGLEPVQLGRKTTSGRPRPFGSLEDAIRTLPVCRSLLTFVERKQTVVRDQLFLGNPSVRAFNSCAQGLSTPLPRREKLFPPVPVPP